ncbi:hypothetical protein ACF0H5_012495 [Mactra antiquata]
MTEEIAVVGIGCRFPGADNIEEYWKVLVNGENHVNDIPAERWNNDAFYSDDKDEQGKHYVKKAGFIKNHDEWDNKLFQVSDTEAVRIDPQQRYVLDCTHMAFEDGGITRKEMNGSRTGVYIGVMNDDYKVLASSDHNDDSNYSATGMSTTIIASRVSFVYNLQGPCMVIDTACSSSMIAVHLGCQAIRTGDCEMAVCGGVSSIISPDTFIALCKARMMSATGQCQTFCDTADGYARGEGCGVVILKSYKKALADGNKIWGIIKTGSNQDGRVAQPITAPSGEQQEELLSKVYSKYNVDPVKLQYIEAHGTGTPIGDPTEVNALGRFIHSSRQASKQTSDVILKRSDSGINTPNESEGESSEGDKTDSSDNETEPHRSSKHIIPIGSVKTNIGHTESAAGVAALIKVLLMMKNGKIVPSLHVKKDKSNLNKRIKLEEYGLDVALHVNDWNPDDNGKRICCVNSFGFGGSNSHAIIIQTEEMIRQIPFKPISADYVKYPVVCVSAVDKASLVTTMEQLNNDLTSSDVNLRDVSFTSAFRREHFPCRTLLYGTDVEEILQQIKLKSKNIDKIETNQPSRIIFVFCGVGTTWTGMCREMMSVDEAFRNTVSKIDDYLKPLTGWRMADKFAAETDYSDPFLNHVAIFCVQVALFNVWNKYGITPDVIIGQSVGEVAASYASGALTLEDAVYVIYYRSKILAETTGGKMMVVGNIPIEEIEKLCESHDNKVTIAVYNSPSSCTLSGDANVMDTIKAELEKRNENEKKDILIRPLSVQCAYHSHQVEACMPVIVQQLSHIRGTMPRIRHISTVTGEDAAGDNFRTARYWADNIRQPVRFMHAILKASAEDSNNIFVEIGPRQVLRAHLANILGNKLKGLCVPSMNAKKERSSIYSSLSTLYESGMDLQWHSFIPCQGQLINIPRYGFNKSKILYLPEAAQRQLSGAPLTTDAHMYVHTGGSETEFNLVIDTECTPFVYDHYFLDAILVPGATYVEAAFEVGQQSSEFTAQELSVSAEFVNPFTPPDEKKYVLDIVVTVDDDIGGHSYVVKKDARVLSKGTIVGRTEIERNKIDIMRIKSRCKTYKDKEESYACLDRIDFKYGESLSLIERSWSSTTECLVEFDVPEGVKLQSKSTNMHPSIIDAMFQTFAILSSIGADGPTLPKGLSSMVINKQPQRRMYGYSQMVKATPVGNHYNSLLLSPEGHVIAEIQDFYTKTIRIADAPNQSIVYDIAWHNMEVQDNNDVTVNNNEDIGSLLVLGSKRFTNCFVYSRHQDSVVYNLPDDFDKSELLIKEAFENCGKIRGVVYAPCYHIQTLQNSHSSVYNYSKKIFMTMAYVIKMVHEHNLAIPIYVITENVKAAPSLNIAASNVCGSELWGMIRCAMGEVDGNDFRLIDISLNDINIQALDNVIEHGVVNHNEYLVDDGNVYYCKMVEAKDQDIEPNKREIDYEPSQQLILKSTNPAVVLDPHFQMNSKVEKKTTIPNACKIRLHSICLHDSEFYPTSTVSEDDVSTVWPEIDDHGFDVVCLEGMGWIQDKNTSVVSRVEKLPNFAFCYPVDVLSVVSVPLKCTFDISCLSHYVPGMMTVGIVLWNIAELCKNKTSVYIVVDDKTSLTTSVLENMLAKYKKLEVEIEVKDEMVEDSFDVKSAQIAIILSSVTNHHTEIIRSKCPELSKIISIDEFFPRYMQRWVQHNVPGLKLSILNIESLFTYDELIEKVPKVYNWMKAFDKKNEQLLERALDTFGDGTESYDNSMFSLPFPLKPLTEGKNTENYIPLHVFRSEVFRKDGCYILIGGLTGLGWELLQIIAELGAGYIATISRRPPTEEKQVDISNIKNLYGCKIIPLQADITNLKKLQTSLKHLQNEIGEASIRGIFHGGGVVHDMLLSNMTEEDIERPIQPKILGTWNLHVATLDMQLDFFVLHSSIVALMGNPGQCNYAAGNSFQDSFAHYRRSLGLCAQSINWSTLSLGMATEHKELENSLKSQGFYFLSADDVKTCFLRAIMTNPPQVTFGIFDWNRLEHHPTVHSYPFKFADLIEKYGSKNTGFKSTDSKYQFDIAEYDSLDNEGKHAMIVDLLKTMIQDTFVVDASTLNEGTKFVDLGIDSMAAMGFTNAMFDTIQVRIPVVTLLSDTTTIQSLANYIVENIQIGGSSVDASVEFPRRENKSLMEFLQGSVTFMQRSLLNDYVKNPYSRNFMRQADYEVIGLKLKPSDWRVMLNHLLKMNPELRRVYKINAAEGKYESVLLPAGNCNIDIEQVPFDSICNKDSTDDRDKIFFDLKKDLPIRFKMACKKNVTRMRMYIHSVISDLSGVAMLFRDIGSYMKPYICNEQLPEKDTNIIPADAVRSSLGPRMVDMRTYWNLQLSQDVQPFTFGNDLDMELDEADWYQISEELPAEVVERVLNYTQTSGISLYHLVMSVYSAYLHIKINKDFIPIVTNVDMRGHVPQLRSFVTRCINAMPVIADLSHKGSAREYIKKSSDRLHHMTLQSGYPYELIQEEMQSEELKKHVGRHRLVMDNMAHLNQTFKHKRVTIKLSNVFHSRYVYETSLYVLYDLQANKISFDYGYNTKCLSHEEGSLVPGDLIKLVRAFIEFPDAQVDDILQGKVTVIDNIVTTPKLRTKSQVIIPETKTSKQSKGSKISVSSIHSTQGLSNNKASTRNMSSQNLTILRQDCFTKQTSQGWDHDVHVVLALDTSINNQGELILQWGDQKNGYRRHVAVKSVSEIAMKRLNGSVNIFLKTTNKWFVLKTTSETLARDWLIDLKKFIEQGGATRSSNSIQVAHL